jgi:uncharacterized membrane protein
MMGGAFVVLLLVLVFVLWTKVSRLTQYVEALERKLLSAMDMIRILQERGHTAAPAPARPAQPLPQVATPPPHEEVLTPFPPPSRVEPARSAVFATAPDVPGAPPESWEITVGTSWLNKIGVLILVIGVALLLHYSLPYIGSAGLVAIGYALSGTLLATGVWLERHARFQNYAYGLIAGGWAGIYFTTFAMHEVPAAKIIDSDLAAVSLLAAVAAGMIAHSLRYQSQIVTSLTFVVAYATLALSPLSGFSLAASVPLAISVLAVSQRLGWPAISALGIAATYGVFVLRSEVFPGGVMDPASTLPYGTLAVYWLTFEVADLIGLRSARGVNPTDSTVRVSMLALNAAGFLGAIMFISPGTRPELRSTLMFATSAAYLVGAAVRAWLLPDRSARPDVDQPFDVSHAATAMAAVSFAIAIGLRFPADKEGLGWLLETQLLFVAGISLRDRWLRRIASVLAGIVTLNAAAVTFINHIFAGPLSSGTGRHATIAATIAMIWYANREVLRIRGVATTRFEPGYTWAATALLAVAGWATLSPAHLGLAGWILAAVLLESGLRRDHAYTLQGYTIGGLSGYVTCLAFLLPVDANDQLSGWGPAPSLFDVWAVLPLGIAICAGAAVRLLTSRSGAPGGRIAAGSAGALASALTLLFLSKVLEDVTTGPAWTAVGAALLSLGLWRKSTDLRWHGYLMLALGVWRAGPLVFGKADPTLAAIASLVGCLIAIYAMTLISSRVTRGNGLAAAVREADEIAITLLMVGASAMLSGVIVTQADGSLVTLLLGLQGLGLVVAGLLSGERVMRLCGLALLLMCLLKLFLYDLRELDPVPRIFSFVVLGVVLLGISWTYTRFRDQIRKLL